MNDFSNTWYGAVLIYAAIIIVYGIIGGYVAGRVNEGSSDELNGAFAGLFWPLAGVLFLLFGTGYLIAIKPYQLGGSYKKRRAARKALKDPSTPLIGDIIDV